jgi:hypothetical protein
MAAKETSMTRSVAPAAIALLLAAELAATATPPAPWEQVVRWLSAERDRMIADLAAAHATLAERAARENRPDLALRLSDRAPSARPSGYGVLPEIRDAAESPTQKLLETRYSLDTLSAEFPRDARDAALLAARSAAEPRLPLEPWVAELERLRGRLARLEDHLSYHAKWQRAVAEHGDYFRARGALVVLARRLRDLESRGDKADKAEAAKVRAELRARGLIFVEAPGLRVERLADGSALLSVTVWTDIEDRAFLAAFKAAVEAQYAHSEAARAQRFRLELRWHTVPPAALYPGGPPARGASIDLAAHRARFPETALVLTTGAEVTYAWQGKSILLGPSPIARHALAHEFGHLLGFDDGYVRTFEGDPSNAFGVVLVEWTGLSDDLMADPDHGQVTDAMIRTLLDAYGDSHRKSTVPGP